MNNLLANKKEPEQTVVDEFVQDLVESLLNADRESCEIIIDALFRRNFSPNNTYSLVLTPSIKAIGELWHKGRITVAHEHMASQIIEDLIKLVSEKSPGLPSNGMSILITSVEGERHSLAAMMFANLLILEGWRVYYLGPETPAQDVSAYVAQGDIDAVALSIIVEANLDKAEECVSSMMALEQPPLILLGGPAVQKQEDLFSECHIVTDFSDAMDTLDDILGIPTGGQSLSHMLDGIGENIQKTRTTRGMNQGELANQAGVDRAYISLVENGKQNLTMSALVKLADALSIPVSSIIPNDNYRR